MHWSGVIKLASLPHPTCLIPEALSSYETPKKEVPPWRPWETGVLLLQGGENVSTSSAVTHGGQQQTARLHLCSLSCLTSSHSFRLSLSNHLCTSTARQVSYGRYPGVPQSSVMWLPVKQGAGTASNEADFGNKKHKTKNTMLLPKRMYYNKFIYCQ